MNEQRIAELVEKYIDNTATEAERQELLDWYQSVDHSEIIWPESKDQFEKRLVRIKENILPNGRQDKLQNKQRTLLISILSAAAILIVVMMATFFFKNTVQNHFLSEAIDKDTTISPGSNKAILTFSDGSTLALTDTIQNLDLSNQSGFTLYAQDGELTFENTDANSISSISTTLVYNTLSTPRGGQYCVNLPDGSKVWLNAESSLSFPNAFTKDERKVILNGEAYFDIAKNKNTPFIVSIDDLNIEVLGTEFNINAYSDQDQISTTLIEGSVKLNTESHAILLKPNQQSHWDKKKKTFTVENIDTESIVAWKNGYFVFNDTDILTIMSQLTKWYDIEVAYNGDVSDKKYTGSILKRSDIREVLDMLELTETIQFKIEGRRIRVMP